MVETTGTLSLGEALATGISTTVIGLAIVFAVLIILMLVLMVMKNIFYKDPANANVAETAPAPVAKTAPAKEAVQANDDELIAVLTAAVAASLNTSTYNLQIKSYRRVGSNATAWRRAGVNETINNRY